MWGPKTQQLGEGAEPQSRRRVAPWTGGDRPAPPLGRQTHGGGCTEGLGTLGGLEMG